MIPLALDALRALGPLEETPRRSPASRSTRGAWPRRSLRRRSAAASPTSTTLARAAPPRRSSPTTRSAALAAHRSRRARAERRPRRGDHRLESGRPRRRTSSRRSARRARTVAAEDGYNNELGAPAHTVPPRADTEVVDHRDGHARLGQIAALCRDRAAARSASSRRSRPCISSCSAASRASPRRRRSCSRRCRGRIAVLPEDCAELEPFLPPGSTCAASRARTSRCATGQRRASTAARSRSRSRRDIRRRTRPLRSTLGRARLSAARASPSRCRSPAGAAQEPALPGGGLLINDA